MAVASRGVTGLEVIWVIWTVWEAVRWGRSGSEVLGSEFVFGLESSLSWDDDEGADPV